MGCLTELVGVFQSGCECEDEYGSLAVDTGLYVDDLEVGISLVNVKKSLDCGDGSIFDIVNRSREEAERDLITDLTVMISDYNTLKYKTKTAVLGKLKNSVNKAVTNNYHAWLFRSIGVNGGMVKINSFKVSLDDPDSTPNKILSIYDADSKELLHTIPYIENQLIKPDLQLNTDLSYLFVIETPAGVTLRDNKINCNCPSAPTIQNKYFNITSGKADDIDSLFDITPGNNAAYGITFEFIFDCSQVIEAICNNLTKYDTNGFIRIFSKAYQLYVIRKTIHVILNSNAVNRYTLLDNERLTSRINKINSMLQDLMNWLAANYSSQDFGISDCWMCKPRRTITKASIYVTNG